MLCPICRKPVTLDDPYTPFCSERCKLIDLGAWASEKYVVSDPIFDEEELEGKDSESSARRKPNDTIH